MSIGIYKITNPKGKIYVGQSINIERRFKEYQNLNNCKKQIKIYNSLIKYSPLSHIFEILEECSLEQLNEREIYWGLEFKVLSNEGLNLKLGNANGKCSQETKDRISKSNKGVKKPPITNTHRLNMSKSRLGKSLSHEWRENIGKGNKGKIIPQSVRDKISKGNKGKIKHSTQNRINISERSKLQKPMLGKKHSGDTKLKMRNVKLGKKDSEETKINKSKAAIGKVKTLEHRINISNNHPTKKAVLQTDLKGNVINEFISINEASRQTGYRVSDISACCNNKQKTAFGFIWNFK